MVFFIFSLDLGYRSPSSTKNKETRLINNSINQFFRRTMFNNHIPIDKQFFKRNYPTFRKRNIAFIKKASSGIRNNILPFFDLF